MVNWPYVYGAARTAVQDGSLDPSVFDDIAWARYPRVDRRFPSKPPLGGIDLGIGAFSRHGALAVDAVRCLTSFESQTIYMLAEGNPAARGSVFDVPDVRAAFPMADLIRDSIDAAEPRPRSAYYADVSAATIRVFHPPASVDPEGTPSAANDFIADVLHERRLV
jgi:multiple sugar transport system substrate-binding protein